MSQLTLEDTDVGKIVLAEMMRVREEREAWKEAFTATRSYFRNNNGPNAKRYREAIERLKELNLIK